MNVIFSEEYKRAKMEEAFKAFREDGLNPYNETWDFDCDSGEWRPRPKRLNVTRRKTCEFKIGESVIHKQFGAGKVISEPKESYTRRRLSPTWSVKVIFSNELVKVINITALTKL